MTLGAPKYPFSSPFGNCLVVAGGGGDAGSDGFAGGGDGGDVVGC